MNYIKLTSLRIMQIVEQATGRKLVNARLSAGRWRVYDLSTGDFDLSEYLKFWSVK